MTDRTRLVWIESPTNPLLRIVDIAATAQPVHGRGACLAVDSTFATPYAQRPLELGADLVMHSSTKYLGGHSDVLGGCLVTSDEDLAQGLRFHQNAAGAVPSPFDCWLLLRGLKTLALRVQRHSDNALAVARHLENHPAVRAVHHPGLDISSPARAGAASDGRSLRWHGVLRARRRGCRRARARGAAPLHPRRVAGGRGVARRASRAS